VKGFRGGCGSCLQQQTAETAPEVTSMKHTSWTGLGSSNRIEVWGQIGSPQGEIRGRHLVREGTKIADKRLKGDC